jgi:hypothetical protein
MIDVRTPSVPLRRRRRWLAAAAVLVLLTTVGFSLGRPSAPPVTSAPSTPPATPTLPAALLFSAPPSPSPSATRPATAVSAPAELLALPGRVPTRGTGTFAYAPGRGKVLGTGSALRRFRVAVEKGAGEDVRAFAAQVEATLGDPRGWTGGGRVRFQRVAGSDAYDFTVHLATRETAGRLCARGGVDIRVGGRPFTSCRSIGKVVINLDRWRLSAPTYLAAKTPLATYRAYVINHEVGHELGRGHQGCPRRGGPAPVMVQQTLTLRGCTPYAWPRRGNRDLVGPYR